MLKRNITSDSRTSIQQNDGIPTLMDQAINNLAKEMSSKRDEVIKDAVLRNGLSVDEEFIKEHISLITYETDDFDHIWYHFGKPDALRIISIERHSQASLFDERDIAKMKYELRYY